MKANDVNLSFDNYIKIVLKLYNKYFSLKEHTYKEKHNDKLYITRAIKPIKHRNTLQKLYAKWPRTAKISKQYGNMLTSVIRAAKENYCKSKLQGNTGSAKKTVYFKFTTRKIQ